MKKASLTWSLNDLYSGITDPAIQHDFAAADKLIAKLKKYRGKIATLSSTELLKLLQQQESLAFMFHKIGLFAGLLESTNVGDAAVTRFTKQIQEESIKRGQEIIFIDVELARVPPTQWQKWLKAKELQPYHNFLEQTYKQAKHTLSESEEKVLAEKSQTSWQALDHLFEVTTSTLMFEWDKKQITLEEVLQYFHSSDPQQRKQAALTLHKGLQTNNKTTPPILNALVQDKAISDRLRGYSYPEEARFLNEEVDKPTVDALIQAVSDSYQLIARYYQLKKKILKVTKMYWWDRYAPLPQTKTEIPIDQAKAMVLESFKQFSPQTHDIAATIMFQQHIDWLPSPTKRGGAFCAFGGNHNNQSLYPYILLNYTNQLRDVTTLAHELGHGIHDVLAQSNNTFFQTHPSLALAEIASTFSEYLVFSRLLDADITKEDKIGLLMSFIEDSIATIYRQVTMFQFEQALHTKRRTEGELSREQLDDLWHTSMQQPFASSLIYTNEHKNSWMYVHHIFAMPFYVFSYAFAKLCVLGLIQQYKKQGEAFVPTYLDILKSGGSQSPKDTLAQAGLNITKPTFWKEGIAVIEEYINVLEKTVETR